MQEETDMEQKNEQSALILVVDDEPDIRHIIRILLESGGYRVAEAQNGLAAVEYVRKQPGVDLVLMDIMMPGLDGVSASREIRECCAAPILFLTAKTQEQDKLEAYQAGGDDYLAKPFSHAELMLDEPGRRVLRGGRSVELTETEFEILCFLAAHRGSVVSVEQIYRGVWREKYMPSSTNTVMVHIVNLRKKLEEDPTNPRLIRTVWGKGYQID